MLKYLAHRVYNMFKELTYFIRGQKTQKRSQIKLLERKNMLLDMGNAFNRFIGWLGSKGKQQNWRKVHKSYPSETEGKIGEKNEI